MSIKVPPRRASGPVAVMEMRRPSHSGGLGKAKILTNQQVQLVLLSVMETSQFAHRDRLYVLLSHYCGMRAKEIANLWVEDIMDASGVLTDRIEVTKRAAKYGRERTLPMRPEVREALAEYIKAAGLTAGPIFWDYTGKPVTANAVQKQIKAVYVAAGFTNGARSHSGRRKFITTMAQKANTVGASLKDVMVLAGHANLSTTEGYIDTSPHADKLVGLL